MHKNKPVLKVSCIISSFSKMCEVVKCLIISVTLIYFNGVYGQSDLKSSLVFVIDSTASMSDDIEAVKKQANAIFDVVTNSNTSQVEDFVLVEFNDPEVKFHTKTKNRELFKSKLNSLRVHGGDDCPEMSLSGIQTALEESGKGSELYVFTDAFAKDEYKYETVKKLAQHRGCKITFIVSEDYCIKYEPYSPVYENLADATEGQVFPLQKNNVEEILNYVKESIKSRKNLISQKKFAPGNHKFNYTVDSNLKELVVSVTGNNLKLEITDPHGDVAETEELVKTSKITIVKVAETIPGVYTAEVESDAPGNMNVYGTSTVHFEHGFSRLPPTAIEETTLRPYPDEKSYLSVKVNVEGGDLQLQSIELYDLNDNLLVEKLLDLVNIDDQFYATREAFIPPNKSFRIAIKGVDLATKAIITRFGLTPIEPQERIKDAVADKAPNVTIVGVAEVHVEYEQPVELKCRVSGYPKPLITWEDETGTKIDSEETQIEIPYDYVSVIEIKSVDANKTIFCKASNSLGEDRKVIEVLTRRTRYFDILEKPKDAVIEFGKDAEFVCKVDSAPEKAYIRWYRGNKKLRNNRNFEISRDESVLTIKNMTPELDGQFKCIASNNLDKKGFTFHVSTTGLEKPEIEKGSNEVHVRMRSTATIECKIIKGIPEPNIKWYFKPAYSNKIQRVKGGKKIFFNSVTVRNAGTYSCKAENHVGYDVHFVDLIVEYAPRIANTKKVVRTFEGHQVKLPCYAVAEPQPDVSWYFNGKLINDKPFHRLANNDLSFKANTNLTGEYKCEAINKLGVASSKISVFIIVPVTIDKPEESTYEKAVGEDLVLTCNASGEPKPKVHWVYNSMDFSTPSEPLTSSETDSTLHLKRLQVDQEGHYTCIASNSGSSANFTYTVNVLAPPVIVNERPDKTFKAVAGDLVLRIPCKTIGSPTPTITWEKDGYNIAAGTEWYDIENGTLLVKYADKAAEGFYTCKAENRIGSDVDTYQVLVEDFPKPGAVSDTILLEEGSSSEIPCPVSHEGVDLLRWYKDNKLIANGALNFRNVNISDDGIYTCRVSNFIKSTSGSLLVEIGYKPKFVYNPNTEIEYAEGNYAELDCFVDARPDAEISWWHDGNQLKENSSRYRLKMASMSKGKYFCLAKNQFGSAVREFSIASKECVLHAEKDFGPDRPMIVTKHLDRPSFETIDGYIHIPKNNTVALACPSEFQVFDVLEIRAVCVEGTIFTVNGRNYDFSDFKCVENFEPLILDTNEHCLDEGQIYKIGYETDGNFLEVFEVCFNDFKKQPSYAKYKLDPAMAGTRFEDETWYDSEFIPIDFDEMYDCTNQNRWISGLLRRTFNEDCCFSRRQLVNARDMLPGLQQMATYSNLNVIPHWSTCKAKNWDLVEELIRRLVRKSNYPLTIWSGASNTLQLQGSRRKEDITITDNNRKDKIRVPKFIWKVVQDPRKKASLAIIQVNIPDLKQSEALKYVLCKDICSDIPWIKRNSWRDVKHGFVYCCSIKEFKKNFKLYNVFESDMERVLV